MSATLGQLMVPDHLIGKEFYQSQEQSLSQPQISNTLGPEQRPFVLNDFILLVVAALIKSELKLRIFEYRNCKS